LVSAFATHEADYLSPSYNETQARTDFITPLLAALGWDVYNRKLLPPSLREVLEEANVSVADDAPSRRPDYELRLARTRKLFVEAKKPSINIHQDAAAAFQARRYGYSAGMPIVVLTNFRQLAVYDCTIPPALGDAAHVARIDFFEYTDFEPRLSDLWEYVSRDAVYSGQFDERYTHELFQRGSAPFDELFLEQVRAWRYRLAVDIFAHAPELSANQLTYAVQIFLSRLIFLRICEDRDLEQYAQLREIAIAGGFGPYRELLQRADDFYDSGLFDLMTDSRLGTVVSDETLAAIIDELYYPRSPYTFSVVQTEVLGRIYEQFLGEQIEITNGTVVITNRPEVRESGGVVPTPRDIVDEIVDRALRPLLDGKSVAEVADLTVLDMCCGSGVFLLSAYERLCDHYLAWYVADGVERHRGNTIFEVVAGTWRLTFPERRQILLRHIRGVDIDSDAVEVAQLSLLLKLVEGESQADLAAFITSTSERALPDLASILRSGNSLVQRNEWVASVGPLDAQTEAMIRPFDWPSEFPTEFGRGGFDAIVGNPPYIRIQNMARYSPREVRFYQQATSPYSTGHQDNFDKYVLFIERGLSLLSSTGRLGFIAPHKFMSITSGRAVRELLAERISEIVHFGSQPVFPGTSNYTAILIVGPPTTSALLVEPVSSITAWRLRTRADQLVIDRDSLSAEPWQFASQEFSTLRQRLQAEGARPLRNVAEIFVGLQTSADDVYIVKAESESQDAITFEWDGRDWTLERAVLRPFLHDVQIEAFTQPTPNKWLIFPYEITNGTAHLVQPEVMESEYPGCWAYLIARRDELDGRNITGGIAAEHQWYQYGRSQSLTKFEGTKIVLPILSLEPRYALDEQEIRVTGGGNGPYYLIRSTDASLPNEVLLAILNHPLSEAVVRSHTSVFRGGYYSHGKQFIENIPIPRLSDNQVSAIEEATREVIATRQSVRSAVTPDERALSQRRFDGVRSNLTDLVSEAFGLGAEDLLVVEGVPAP